MAILVLVTIPKEKAESLSKVILEKRLCACVNILGEVASYFWWEGKIDTASESLLLIKTKSEFFNKLKEVIKKNHPYQVPEIIAFNIDKINQEYLDWVNKETSDK